MKASNLSWQDALSRLKAGNQRFINDKLNTENVDTGRRQELSAGQHPFAVILGCADSRVVPELVFDTGLGELFTIRVAGNVANSSTLASIEYAAAHLDTNLIVVLGHENCGAVTAAINGGDLGYNLNHLLMHIIPAMNASEDKSVNAVVKKNAELTAREIIRRSPIIQEEATKRELKVVSAYYNLASGKVDFFE
ncbi:MAG: carbonic anhydrase [Phaeodactylibacter sp.]|nr:carbonic anhydrase [Phaeodactylibacter sp.]